MLKRAAAQAVIVIGVLLAASLSSVGTGSAHATTTADTPRVGQCHRLSRAQADGYTDSTNPVACSARHDTTTFAVPTLSTPMTGMSQDQLTAAGAAACTKPFLALLGRTAVRRAESTYSYVYFQPTAAQMQAGEAWFRCDLVLVGGDRLLPLPKRLPHPVLPRRADDHTTRCLTTDHVATPCSSRHAYRPIGAVRFKPAPYPSSDDFRQAGSELCPAGSRYFTWSAPGRWAAGDRVLVCYRRTSR